MIRKLEDLRNATDKELLACVSEAKGHTGNDFQTTFGTDYSYSCITNELTTRGYVNGWHKVQKPKTIKIKFTKNNARMNLNMTKECKERYEKFLSDKSYNFIHTTAAIMNYLDEVEEKEINVNIEAV